VDPQAEMVAGYGLIMPTGFGERLTDQDIEAIISFVRSPEKQPLPWVRTRVTR